MQHHLYFGNKTDRSKDIIAETAWEQWQALYAVKRRKIFLCILETQKKCFA